MKKKFLSFLLAELIVIAAAIASFTVIHEKIVAGVVAGTLFVALGVWIVVSGVRNRAVRKTPTFVMGCVHLFAVALPLMITRLLNYSAAFEDVRVLGLSGPVFHELSTAVYFIMMGATAFDWFRAPKTDGKTAQ